MKVEILGNQPGRWAGEKRVCRSNFSSRREKEKNVRPVRPLLRDVSRQTEPVWRGKEALSQLLPTAEWETPGAGVSTWVTLQ